jgi:hypothetical protein
MVGGATVEPYRFVNVTYRICISKGKELLKNKRSICDIVQILKKKFEQKN